MIGSAVGPYRVVEKLGAGGMGEVYLGHDSRLQRKVALKSLTAPASADADRREQILREARAAARLNHPGIAAVYDVVEQGDRAYIVMEYVEGETLAARLAQGPLPMDRVFTIGRELAAALAAAHAGGVVHHDLKPANIQLTPNGAVKVLDFGVARVTTPTAMPTETTRSVIPVLSPGDGRSGTIVYMAPEQLLNKRVDARSDIYSLGVVLFEMATGRRPFKDTDLVGLAVAMSNTPAPTADSLNPRVPRALAAVIARALEARPEQRYQSASELEAALADAESVTGARAIWRRARVPAAVAVLILTLAGGAALLTRSNRQGQLAAARPTILAILPVDNPSGDPQAEYLGAAFSSLLSGNFASAPGLTVLSRESTAPYEKTRDDLSPLGRELGADLILDLSIKTARPTPVLVVRLRRPDANPPIWDQTLTGDALTVERSLVDGAGRAIEEATGRRLTTADWTRVRTLPTTTSEALVAYSEARALLDRFDVPGNIDRAVALLNSAVASDPRFALAQAALGDAYWAKYQRDKDPGLATRATDAVVQAIQLDSTQAPIYYSLGNMQYLTGRYEDATNSLRHSLAIQPDNDETHRLLGLVLADRGDVGTGVAELRQAIRIRPQYWRNHTTLGYVFYRAGRYREALEPYRRATELQPTNANAFSALGTIYHRLGVADGKSDDINRAIGYYEHAVRLGPNAAAYANLALGYYSVKRYADALAAYKQAIAAEPKSVLNHHNIGDVYTRLGRLQEARAEYEQAIAFGEELLKVNSRDYRTIIVIAQCESKMGRRLDAERHAAEARTLAPTDQETLQYSAEVHVRLGQLDAALNDLEAAIEHGYSRREARDNDELLPLRGLPRFQRLVAGPEHADNTRK